MTHSVLLRDRSSGGYIATALDWPNCVVEAPTREEALEQIRIAITELLTEGEIVEVEVPLPQPIIAASYDDTFGVFRDDPTFPEFVEEVKKYRRKRNQVASE